MYNIKKAVSRLEFAPKLEEIEITDVKRGLGSFSPRPGKPVSFAALKEALKKAGYRLDSAEITVTGVLSKDESGWWLEPGPGGQRFAIEASGLLEGLRPGARVQVTGDWRTVVEAKAGREVVRPRDVRVVGEGGQSSSEAHASGPELYGIIASVGGAGSAGGGFLAPVRATSPGLTVYKGGALTSRYEYARQHLGGLEIDRHSVRLAASYTPTPRLQLEIEAPFSRTSFRDGAASGASLGAGNVTLWSKYRFHRALETWGDRQAAARLGVELPTGRSSSRRSGVDPESEFVRRQLGPINGGLSLHADLAYSQARGRIIFGGNVEGIIRSERDGFRMGHEARVNTDLEFVVFPLKYRRPTGEIFAILETTYVHRGRGHALGAEVAGSGASEFFVAPALQYVATPRLLLEASLQLPLIHNSGARVLRTDRSLIVGLRFLY